jgi:hypothetical protein
MKYITFLALSCIVLTGCTTPKTMLKNSDTGQIVSCGGNISSSLANGAFGYYMQKSNDADCKFDYLEQGFEIIRTQSE